jgi:hypothetical protein
MTICIACETTCPFLLAGLFADDGLKVLEIIVVVFSHAAAARTVSWQTFCKMSGKGKGKVVTARAQSQGNRLLPPKREADMSDCRGSSWL